MNKFSSAALALAVSAVSLNLSAFERDHDAHVHGHAMLAIAIEKNEVMMELTSPAMNIIGFEHQPKTKEDKAAVKRAEHELKHADEIFVFNDKAGCELEHVMVKSSLLEDDHHKEHDEHHHDEHDDDHHDDHHDEHGHKDHDDDHHDGHGGHEEHDEHSEFVAEYHFECSQIDQLESAKIGLFDAFSGMEEVEAQLSGPKGQSLQELSASKAVVKF